MLTGFLKWGKIFNVMKKKGSFASLGKDCQDEWEFLALLRKLTNDQGFEKEKLSSKRLKDDIGKYIELANEAERIANKYFGKRNVRLQAYYTKVKGTDRVLNINLINYNRSEPTRISDILQQEKGISGLNVYCNKRHEVYAYQKGKERNYEFKEGARYEMISTWPVRGKLKMCTMIMNVSSEGITEILKFNGKDFVESEEILELIKQNNELHIQGLPLYDAVKKSLKRSKAISDVVAVANGDLQSSECIRNNQDRGKEEGAESYNLETASFSASSYASTQTQVEISLQNTESQTEIGLQLIDGLMSENCRLRGENAELMQLNEQLEYGSFRSKLEEKEQENIKLKTELEQKNEELTSMLEDMEKRLKSMNEKKEELEKNLKNIEEAMKMGEEQLMIVKVDNETLCESNDRLRSIKENRNRENAKLQAKIVKKDGELARLKEEKGQETENLFKENSCLKERLKVTEKKLKDEVKTLEEDREEAISIMKEREKYITSLKSQMQRLENEYKATLESDKEEMEGLIWKIEELKNELKVKDEQSERVKEHLKAEIEKEILEEYQLPLELRFREYNGYIACLKSQMQKLRNELEFVKGERKQFRKEEEDEIDGCRSQEKDEVDGLEWEKVPLALTSDGFDISKIMRKNEELKRELEELREIIEDMAQTICSMEYELQSEKEEVKCLKDQVKYLQDQIDALDEKIYHEQKQFNYQFYTIVYGVFDGPLLKKEEIHESSNVDSAYNSENEDDNLRCSSVVGFVSHQQVYSERCKSIF